MKSLILEILYKCSKRNKVAKSVIGRSSILTFFHSACLKANIVNLEESSLCLPSLFFSYGQACSNLVEKPGQYSSMFSSIITTLSFYLRQLIEAFPHIKKKSMAYGLLLNVFEKFEGLAGLSKYESIFSTADMKNVIDILAAYQSQSEGDLVTEKAITPSRILIQELLPAEYFGEQNEILSLATKFIFSAGIVGVESSFFVEILCWVSNIVVKDISLHERFGKWLITCRLSNTHHDFSKICKCFEWEVFMKNLYLICYSRNEKSISTIYSSLLMLIISDMDFKEAHYLELVHKIPAPCQILEQPIHLIGFTDGELIFEQLKGIIWSNSGTLRND